MKVSFIIGFHTARTDNLLQTLHFLEKWHSEVISECELVTVCQDKAEKETYSQIHELAESFKTFNHFDLDLPCMQLPYVTNFGIEKTKSEKLIILESDRILPEGYFSDVIDQLEEGIQITTKNMKKLQSEVANCEIGPEDLQHGYNKEDFDFKWEHRSETNEIGMRNMWSGNTAIMKSDFYKAGRMDEEYEGYGWADSDMTYAMEAVGVQSVYRDEIELHLWHPPATYGEGDQKQMFIDNGLRFCTKWHKDLPEWFKQEIRDHRGTKLMI